MAGVIPITITLRERDLLLNETTAVGEEVLAKMRVAENVGGGIRFSLTPEDFNLLLGSLASEANHADSEVKEMAFGFLLYRLMRIFERHTAQEETQASNKGAPPKA